MSEASDSDQFSSPAVQPSSGTYRRAVAGYDDEHRENLVAAIVTALAKESVLADAKIMALRTGELTDALLSVLIGILAMSPETNTPTKLRQFAEAIRKRVIRGVPQAREDAQFRALMASVRNVSPTAGNA
jgi:hypothetical protein